MISRHENILWLLLGASRARRRCSVVLAQRQRARLAEMVAFARVRSRYYIELYRNLPERIDDPALLPVRWLCCVLRLSLEQECQERTWKNEKGGGR